MKAKTREEKPPMNRYIFPPWFKSHCANDIINLNANLSFKLFSRSSHMKAKLNFNYLLLTICYKLLPLDHRLALCGSQPNISVYTNTAWECYRRERQKKPTRLRNRLVLIHSMPLLTKIFDPQLEMFGFSSLQNFFPKSPRSLSLHLF